MPPSRHQATDGDGRRIVQTRKASKKESPSRRSDRLAEQDVGSEDTHSETADDILARSPPPDELEYISKTTRKTGMFWAPLLSGSTHEEKHLMDEELAATGRYAYPELYHPQYVKTRSNDPGNFKSMHFFEGQDPEQKAIIAGIPDEPMNLDPPGTGGPFDALKHPNALVARLNQTPNDPNGLPYGWNDKALATIPLHILTSLPAETVAALPESLRSSLMCRILAGTKRERLERSGPPVASQPIRRSQRSLIVEDEAWTSDLAKPPTRPTRRTTSRLGRRTQAWEIPTWDLKDALVRPLMPTTYDLEEHSTHAMMPAIASLDTQIRLATKMEKASTEYIETPSTSSSIPAISRWNSPDQDLPSQDGDTLAKFLQGPPVRPVVAVVPRSSDQSQRLSHDEDDMAITESEDSQTKPTQSKARRWIRRSQRLYGRDEDIPDNYDWRAVPHMHCPSNYRIIRPQIPGTLADPGLADNALDLSRPFHSSHSSVVKKRGRGKPPHACDHCRVKKIRCDRVKPSCTSCQNFGIQCSLRAGNAQPSTQRQLAVDDEQVDDEPEEQPEENPQARALAQLEGLTNEPLSNPKGYSIHAGVLATVPEPQDRGYATAGDSGPVMDDLDSEDDTIDFEHRHVQPFVSVSGITHELAGRFTGKSATDHLDLFQNTSIPLKFHPKPVFSQIPNFPKRSRARTTHAYNEICTPQEEIFMTRPSVRIVVPDHLKNLLVDDWENVTKSLLVVPLPSKAPVNFIIDSYFDEEKGKRRLGSAEADVLEEFVAGMKVYFDKAIGKTLLYKFERPQWAEIRQLWESGKYPEWNGKGPGDAYGAEHLCRMLVNMPEMVAQTNMDVQSVNRLREEISRLCTWLARNSGRFFCAKYEKPTAEYIEGAR